MVSASGDATMRVWDLTNFKHDCETVLDHCLDGSVLSCDFLPSGRRLVSSAHNGRINLWDMTTYDVLWTVEPNAIPVWCIRATPDGDHVLTGADDGSLALWSISRRVLVIPAF